MSDLVEFLKARLDEDEQVARAATSHTGRWRWDHGSGAICNDPDCEYGALVDNASPGGAVQGTVLMEVHGYDIRESWQGAKHIALHNPARVLRDVEAKRTIVRRARDKIQVAAEDPNSDFLAGSASAYLMTLRLLALPYAGHPDYDESWRP